MSILTATNITGDTLAIRRAVKWSFKENGVSKTKIAGIGGIGGDYDEYTQPTDMKFECIVKFPVKGTYKFTYDTSGLGTIYMSEINVVLTETTPFSKGSSRSSNDLIVTITTTEDNKLMKMMLVSSQYYNYFFGDSGPDNWSLSDNVYALCETGQSCDKIVIPPPDVNSLLYSSSCLTINGNTLVSKGTVKWIGTNNDNTVSIWYEKITNGTVNASKTYKKLAGECILKFPQPGTYNFTVSCTSGVANIYSSNINEMLTENVDSKRLTTTGTNNHKLEFTTSVVDELRKLLITCTVANSIKIAYTTYPTTITTVPSIHDNIFCLCDDNTLNNCTYLLPNNVTVIQGMVQRAFYKDTGKNFTTFTDKPFPERNTLFSTTYTSSLNILNNDIVEYEKTSNTVILTSIITGYLTFPKSETYYWSTENDDHCTILFGSATMPIDFTKKPTTDSIYYSKPMVGNPTIDRPMIVTAGTSYRFVIIYHNSGGPGFSTVLIKEKSLTATPMSIPLSWISSDYTLDFKNAYQEAINKKCGATNTTWSTENECADILNDNVSNILRARTSAGSEYVNNIITQCRNLNGTTTVPAACSKVYNFKSKDSKIVQEYCKDQNRFILDESCRNFALTDRGVPDWSNRQLNYCTSSYANLISAPCKSYYNTKNNKAEVYATFCGADSGAKMMENKDSSNDCLVNDVVNLDRNLNYIRNKCNNTNTTLFNGYCNDMAADSRLNETITISRINSCTDTEIDNDLTTKKACFPYLSDPTRIDKVNSRIVSYCEAGKKYGNELCTKFYGPDGAPLTTNNDPVIQRSLDYRIQSQCVENGRFKTDTNCANLVLNNIKKYAAQTNDYCVKSDNIGSKFCKDAYTSLIASNNLLCNPSQISNFSNKDNFMTVPSLVKTLNGMNDYNCGEMPISWFENSDDEPFDIGFMFMMIFLMVIVSLLISFLIVRYKKKKDLANNNLNKTV